MVATLIEAAIAMTWPAMSLLTWDARTVEAIRNVKTKLGITHLLKEFFLLNAINFFSVKVLSSRFLD